MFFTKISAIYIDNRTKPVPIARETGWGLETGEDGQGKTRSAGDSITGQTSPSLIDISTTLFRMSVYTVIIVFKALN